MCKIGGGIFTHTQGKDTNYFKNRIILVEKLRKMKIGIAGVGHLGKIHLKLALASAQYDVVGFFDADPKNAAQVAKDFGVSRYDSFESLVDAVEVIDIVTPTPYHAELAAIAIQKDKHVFIEKPVTQTVAEAEMLMDLLKSHPVKLQVGHVERFNPAYLAVKEHQARPLFIEAHRLAMYNPRGTDVSVVHDLMIHDLDILLDLVDSEVKEVMANGVSIVSPSPDICNARIVFENGCVANVTASRISMKNMRKIRLFQNDAYLSIDFLDKSVEIIHLFDKKPANHDHAMSLDTKTGKKWLTMEMPEVKSVNSILMELETFAEAIQNDTEVDVDLEAGMKALVLAEKISDQLDGSY